MAGSSFTVELDTHAPVLAVAPGVWNAESHTLTIPCTTDEAAMIAASFEPFGSTVAYPLWWAEGALVATLPTGVSGANGRAHVSATDDLLNQAEYTITVGREPVFTPVVWSRQTTMSGWRGDGPKMRLVGVTPTQSAPRVNPTAFPTKRRS